jgi:hypothetical protein
MLPPTYFVQISAQGPQTAGDALSYATLRLLRISAAVAYLAVFPPVAAHLTVFPPAVPPDNMKRGIRSTFSFLTLEAERTDSVLKLEVARHVDPLCGTIRSH